MTQRAEAFIVDALRTPHVALAARTLRKEPLKRYRLGEFVPSLVSRGCKGDAQKETVADPEETLVNETPVDLRLYYDKKLRPELERLLSPFAGDPAVTALFARALRASPGVLAKREDAKALFQGAAASSTHPRRAAPECTTPSIGSSRPIRTALKHTSRAIPRERPRCTPFKPSARQF